MKKLYLILLTLIAFSSGLLQAENYSNKTVSEIVIVNKKNDQTSLNAESIKVKLLTKVNGKFSQDDFDADLKLLSKEFAQVNPRIKANDKGLEIILELSPKPIIKKIIWDGNKQFKLDKLEKELSINPSSEFDPHLFNEAFNKVRNYYIKHGFFESKLKYSIENDEDNNEVDIHIDIEEGRLGKIKHIAFNGTTKEEEQDILSNITTKKYNMLTSWYSGSGKYNTEMVEMDKFAVIEYYNNKGYADAYAEINLVENKKKDNVSVEISVDKGEKYIFEDVKVSGNTLFNNTDIEKHLTIKAGDAYSEESIRQSIQQIYELYGKQGYIETSVHPETKLNKSKASYAVNFNIEEGAQYKIGLVKISGNYVTQNKVILHETLLIPGDVFNIRKLQATENKLRNIGYFKNVNVYAANVHDINNLGPEFRDVIIELEEVSTGSIGLSVGFSSSDNGFVGLDILERNFNVLGFPNIFSDGYQALRGAGEYGHLKMSVGKKQRTYLASWMKPFFMDSQWTVSFDIEKTNNRYQSDYYNIDTISFSANAYYNINQFVKFGCRYELKDSELKVLPDASQEIIDRTKNNGIISSIGTSLIYDSTNSPNKPTRGLRSKISLDYAGLGGKANFLKFGYFNNYYTPLFNKCVLKYTLDMNFVDTLGRDLDDLPLSEFLFLGGEDSVRGFEPYTIGPKDSKGKPVGGLSSTLVSVEYLYQLHNKFGLFTFVDGGYVTRSRYSIDTLRTSAGLGMRIEVFPSAPPIAIGYGFPINAKNRSDEKRFFLTLGAKF